MQPEHYDATEAEVKAARRRVVGKDDAVGVIRGITSAVLEGIFEAQKKLLSDGGCVRALPVNGDGDVSSNPDFANAGITAEGIATAIQNALRFRQVTQALNDSADGMLLKNLDWGETERFSEIA